MSFDLESCHRLSAKKVIELKICAENLGIFIQLIVISAHDHIYQNFVISRK